MFSWDNYPQWHAYEDGDAALAQEVAFVHDVNRCLKGGRPYMLMESTPSMTNWRPVAKLKRPGMHRLSSLQAVAHGSDTVQYFQWRKSRGSTEKFHGAVVDHVGHENTRVFRDVAELGGVLKKLNPVIGTTVRSEVAILFDWENQWGIQLFQGTNNHRKRYVETCFDHYRPFWQMSVPVDVIDQTGDFTSYKLLVAPMMYMLRPGVAQRVEQFVRAGGTFVTMRADREAAPADRGRGRGGAQVHRQRPAGDLPHCGRRRGRRGVARALRAARRAHTIIASLAADSDAATQARLRFGLALHVREALYGNIGGGARLDFTCIGPAVNLAARIENLAGKLGRVIVGSSAFARHLPQEFVTLGAFGLAGFRNAETVFGLREDGSRGSAARSHRQPRLAPQRRLRRGEARDRDAERRTQT